MPKWNYKTKKVRSMRKLVDMISGEFERGISKDRLRIKRIKEGYVVLYKENK